VIQWLRHWNTEGNAGDRLCAHRSHTQPIDTSCLSKGTWKRKRLDTKYARDGSNLTSFVSQRSCSRCYLSATLALNCWTRSSSARRAPLSTNFWRHGPQAQTNRLEAWGLARPLCPTDRRKRATSSWKLHSAHTNNNKRDNKKIKLFFNSEQHRQFR
jgi:hypothetical protein